MKKRFLFLLLFSSILFSLVCAEVILRLVKNFNHPNLDKLCLVQKDPYSSSSYRLKPNLNIITKLNGSALRIVTNSHGMRWREVPFLKPKDKKRIAFVGDSFTFGCWADSIEKSFAGIFESDLPSKEFEVLNFGIVGYGFSDIELQIKEEVVRFSPDYIILVSSNGNDFRDTYLGVNKYDISSGACEWNKENLNKKIPPSFRQDNFRNNRDIKAFLYNNSELYKLLLYVKNQFKSRNKNGTYFIKSKKTQSFTSYLFWSQAPYPDIALQAKDMSLASLKSINEFCVTNNIKLMIVTLPYREQVYNTTERGDFFDINLPQKFIEDFAKANNMPYLDLLPLLREAVKNNHEDCYLENDPHLNNRGHYVTGNAITKWFKDSR